MVEKYTAPTVGKTFRILKSISRTPQGQTLSEISQQLGISKSTVHGISAALEALGAVKRDANTRRFHLGATLFELGRPGKRFFSVYAIGTMSPFWTPSNRPTT